MSDAQLADAVVGWRADLRAVFADLDRVVDVATGFGVRAYHPRDR
jgi:hypothetical protein